MTAHQRPPPTDLAAKREQRRIAADYRETLGLLQAATSVPPDLLDRVAVLERLAQDQARTIAAQDARIAALEAQPAADEDGASRPGVWCTAKEAMRLTDYSRSGLRKLRQQNRIVFDCSGPRCLYDVTSIVRKKVRKVPA
jgi:hypothetical protein